jgi:hypothetical protein
MCSGPMMRLNSYQIAAADKYACYRDLVPPTTTMASIVQTLGAKKSGVNTWTQRFLPKVPVWLPANFVGVLLLQPYDLRRTNSAIEYSAQGFGSKSPHGIAGNIYYCRGWARGKNLCARRIWPAGHVVPRADLLHSY